MRKSATNLDIANMPEDSDEDGEERDEDEEAQEDEEVNSDEDEASESKSRSSRPKSTSRRRDFEGKPHVDLIDLNQATDTSVVRNRS